MASFAIIGAGLAGISLAHRLKKAGHHCSVFEKSRGRGGRLSTRRCSGWQADHGTQYFTARSPNFKEEVAIWQQKGWVNVWDVQPWMLERETFIPSPDDQKRFVGAPTMNAMVHGLSEGLDVYTDTRIDRLENQETQWRLWDERGEHYGLFDAVLLTAPMAQSLALLPEGTRSEASLRNANMTPTWAYAVALSEPTNIQADALFSNDGIVTWAAKDSAKPGRPSDYETWVIHFSANWTANHLDASEQLLEQQSRHLLERLSGNALNIHESFQHRWLYARSASQATPVIQWDADKRIGLAGDWTIGSRLEDAWQSAQTLADKVLDEFQ